MEVTLSRRLTYSVAIILSLWTFCKQTEIQPIPFEDENRTNVFNILNTVRSETNSFDVDDNNEDDDDDIECEALLDLLHFNNHEDVEQQESQLYHKNSSEELLDFFQSRVTNAQLDLRCHGI